MLDEKPKCCLLLAESFFRFILCLRYVDFWKADERTLSVIYGIGLPTFLLLFLLYV